MKSQSISTKQSPLNKLQKEFEIWRKNKSNNREQIPDHLWKKSAKLTKLYTVSTIASTLRFSSKQFHNKSKQLGITTVPKNKTTIISCKNNNEEHFIELPIKTKLAHANNGEASKIEINSSDGIKLCIESISNDLILSIINKLFYKGV